MIDKDPYRIAFIVEQALGHITHGENLQACLAHEQQIQPHWVLPPFPAAGLAARLPLYRSNWTVRSGWRARRGLAALRRQTTLDGLFFHTQVPAVFAQDWLKRLPAVVSLDATPQQYDELGAFYGHQVGPSWLERWKWRLNRDALHAARHVVTWSQWAKDGLVEAYEMAAEDITVIPPGVNPVAWTCPTERKAGNEVVKILFVGADFMRKGGEVLLEAFRQLRREGTSLDAERPRVALHLVTRTKLAAEPDVYVYNDLQPNSAALRALYHRCDIFALPTYGDALPMVLSEAGAAGLPAVSTRVAAIPEVVHDGSTGLLVPPGDGRALATALRTLVDNANLRLEMGAQAQQLVIAEFDARRNAERLLTLLRAMIDVERRTV